MNRTKTYFSKGDTRSLDTSLIYLGYIMDTEYGPYQRDGIEKQHDCNWDAEE